MADLGMMTNPRTEAYDQWYAVGGSVRFAPVPAWGIAARYEYVHDPHQIINELITQTTNGFQMRGTTLTLEHLPAPQVTIRLQGRYSKAKDPIFNYGDNQKKETDFFCHAGCCHPAQKLNGCENENRGRCEGQLLIGGQGFCDSLMY